MCDKSTPVMAKLHHLTLRTSAALKEQRDKLNESRLFDLGAEGNVDQETEEVFGPKVQPKGGVDGAKDDDSNAANEEMDLQTRFVWEQEKRKPEL